MGPTPTPPSDFHINPPSSPFLATQHNQNPQFPFHSLLLRTKNLSLYSLSPMLRSPTLSFNSSAPLHLSRGRRMSVRAEVAQLAVAAPDRKSLYEVLRVKRNASQVEIKSAYRTLAKLYHPDATARFMDSSIASPSSSGGDFIEIHNAYATLSDPDARAEYDLNLSVDPRRRRNPAGTSGYRSPGMGRFYQTRRWETDQCW